MVNDFGFDGLDLDFEFPSSSNIDAYSSLIQALRTGLDKLSSDLNTTPFTISIAVAGDIKDGQAYQDHIKDIDPVIDWWHVMAYDLCESNYQATACDVGNLSGGSTSGSATIEWYITNGASASKMVLGSPLYGYTYAGTSGHDQSYDKSITPKGDGDNGPGGYDVKHLPLSTMKNPQITEDTDTGASWAYDSATKTLASYDTPKIATLKANYVISQQWAGAMYWEISSDNTGDTSLVAQYANTFSNSSGLHSVCNHISYPNSAYDNVKNGMGNTPASCDDSEPNTVSQSSGGNSTTTTGGDSGNSTTVDDGSSTGDVSDSGSSNSTDTGSGSGSSCQATSNTRRRAKRNHKKRLVFKA
jgi:chitinase